MESSEKVLMINGRGVVRRRRSTSRWSTKEREGEVNEGSLGRHDKRNTLEGCTGHHLQVITMSWLH